MRKSLLKRHKEGQLSIFFGVVMVIIITVTAFVINVGLYVKARINLQNAVDAAAWSGAAVQARQLSNIAYLNWEMRNTYKEWMFKYYVLGQVGLKNVREISDASGVRTSFHMRPFGGSIRREDQDKFNIPSVCIHFAGTHNICDIYGVPGLPRFANNGLGGIDDTFNALLDNIVDNKAKDCSYRSKINFQVANHWIYGVPNTDGAAPTSVRVPQIATDRMGSYPAALELAFRIRNLEQMVNRPPEASIDISNINDFANGDPANERIVKAFFSAYRNLGGPGPGDGINFMKQNFTLTEISPVAFQDAAENSLSNLFIPNTYPKYYLDLKAQVLNLANFFTSFITTSGDIQNTATQTEAACEATKVAIPVPSYPMGFEKNSQVLTYYAVKGKTKFVGLFNPFTSAYDGMEITAYAAAKPFGGKIGPKLFSISEGNVKPRDATDGGFPSAYAYISTYKGPTGDYRPGIPVPHTNNFWTDARGSDTVVGGNPVGATDIRYGIPNILYDVTNDMAAHLGAGDLIQELEEENYLDIYSNTSGGGLYNLEQFKSFVTNNIDLGQSLDATSVSQAIQMVRAPTIYESQNYLIPSVENIESSPSDFVPVVKNSNEIEEITGGNSTGKSYNMSIFAPLYCENGEWYCAYHDLAEIESYLRQDFLTDTARSVETFVEGMKQVAIDIRYKGSQLGSTSDKSIYNSAATVIYDGPITTDDTGLISPVAGSLSCKSITGMFVRYFFGSGGTTNIPSIPYSNDCIEPSLVQGLYEYWQYKFPSGTNQANNYASVFTLRDGEDDGTHLTAYRPGPQQGASDNAGHVNHPFGASDFYTLAKRNFYSTKLFAIKDILSGSSDIGFLRGSPIYAEKNSMSGNCVTSSPWNGCPTNGVSDNELNVIPH